MLRIRKQVRRTCVLCIPALVISWLGAGCVPATLPAAQRELEAALSSSSASSSSAPAAPATPATPATVDESALAQAADLDTIVRLALSRHPDLAEQRARAQALVAESRVAAALPDPELAYEQRHVPLTRPYALGDAEMLMLGIRQSVPPPGVLHARGTAILADARIAAISLRTRELDLIRQIQRAYAAYYLADREVALHDEHLGLVRSIVDATLAAYRGGRASQQDVLMAELAATRLHTELIGARQRLGSSKALLNALMARPSSAPLGPPRPPVQAGDIEARLSALDEAALVRMLEHKRPERQAANLAVEREQALAEAARREARWPMFMIGADYMFSPDDMHRHGYGLMLSMSLPWLGQARGSAVEAAEHRLSAERAAAASVDTALRYELGDARARVAAAHASHALIANELMPQVLRSYEAARAELATPRGSAAALLSAFQLSLDTRLSAERAIAQLAEAVADLERAMGASLTEDMK